MHRLFSGKRRALALLSVLFVWLVTSIVVLPAAAAPASDDPTSFILAWEGTGAAPGKHSAESPGQLVLIAPDDSTQPVMDIPAQSSRIIACGDNATSPDGRHFAFFVGLDMGTLYMMTGTDTLFPVNENFKAMACLGSTGFAYSPDSSRFAYIAFEQTADADEFASGWLHIGSTDSKSELTSFPNVTTFDLNNDEVAFVRFFTNDRGEADEAGIFLWDGNTDREVATIYPQDECRFTSAQIAMATDQSMVLVMGHRCKTGDTRTSWQFYVVDPATRSATLSMSDFQPGAFVSFARTNYVVFAPDKSTAYFTVPDGVTANTVALVAVDMANISPNNVIIPNDVVMPRYDNKPYDFARNASPLVSPDGRWLALVTNTPNNEATVYVLDMAAPAATPITVSAGRRGDSVTTMAFTPDSSQLIFVGGGNDSGENSLFAIDLASGSDARIRRGRYGQGVISPDGTTMALMNWNIVEDPKEPPYLTLDLVDLATSQTTTLFEGATIVDGKVTDQQFAYPLAWRQS